MISGNVDLGMGLKYQSPLRSGSIDFVLSFVKHPLISGGVCQFISYIVDFSMELRL